MSGIESFFDDSGLVQRNGRGQPSLVPKGVKDNSIRADYTRASSLANYVTDNTHLEKWERRYIAKGIGMRPDLAAMAASNPYTTGRLHKPTDREGLARNRQAGRDLDGIIDQAIEVATIHESANYGTAFHEFTEPGNPWPVPPIGNLQAEVKAYNDCLRELGIIVLDTEVFTANDVTMSAGTFDHLMWVPYYGIVVTDKKTGAVSEDEWAVQISTYSKGEVYNLFDHTRTDFQTYADERLPDGMSADFDPDIGLVFRVYTPAPTKTKPNPGPKVEIYELDLVEGWEAAQLAARIRDRRKVQNVRAEKRITAGLDAARSDVADRIDDSDGDYQVLTDLWNTWQHVWNDELTELAKKVRRTN